MRQLLFLIAGLVAFSVVYEAQPPGTDARARELIDTLHLSVLPRESGYLGLIGQSAQTVRVGDKDLAIQSQVYYMLTRERPVNYLHWLQSDDTHILIEGGPVNYFIFHPDGRTEKVVLGRDVSKRRAARDRRAGWLLEGAAPA